MPAYGFGYLWNVDLGPEIVEYLQKIDATLAPFEGRFLAHGGERQIMEGDLPEGDTILLEFPDMSHALGWYESPAYAAIKALRSRHSSGHILLFDGTTENHQATDVLAGLIG
jgi:uncharacterized protein (DUF1330 family)